MITLKPLLEHSSPPSPNGTYKKYELLNVYYYWDLNTLTQASQLEPKSSHFPLPMRSSTLSWNFYAWIELETILSSWSSIEKNEMWIIILILKNKDPMNLDKNKIKNS